MLPCLVKNKAGQQLKPFFVRLRAFKVVGPIRTGMDIALKFVPAAS
jgi:hypothetical protein